MTMINKPSYVVFLCLLHVLVDREQRSWTLLQYWMNGNWRYETNGPALPQPHLAFDSRWVQKSCNCEKTAWLPYRFEHICRIYNVYEPWKWFTETVCYALKSFKCSDKMSHFVTFVMGFRGHYKMFIWPINLQKNKLADICIAFYVLFSMFSSSNVHFVSDCCTRAQESLKRWLGKLGPSIFTKKLVIASLRSQDCFAKLHFLTVLCIILNIATCWRRKWS
jgi:hypothetical protein